MMTRRSVGAVLFSFMGLRQSSAKVECCAGRDGERLGKVAAGRGDRFFPGLIGEFPNLDLYRCKTCGTLYCVEVSSETPSPPEPR